MVTNPVLIGYRRNVSKNLVRKFSGNSQRRLCTREEIADDTQARKED